MLFWGCWSTRKCFFQIKKIAKQMEKLIIGFVKPVDWFYKIDIWYFGSIKFLTEVHMLVIWHPNGQNKISIIQTTNLAICKVISIVVKRDSDRICCITDVIYLHRSVIMFACTITLTYRNIECLLSLINDGLSDDFEKKHKRKKEDSNECHGNFL